MLLVDSWGRRISNLRISLTDLCNFRCVYCMPKEGLPVLPPADYLTKNEIVRFVSLAGQLGVTRIRLTGGEPLLREDILDIVRCLKEIPTVKSLSITTNASRLGPMVKPLKAAGLDRLNISLDSLDQARFERVTLSSTYREVLEATYLALEEGFPIKLNIVALEGLEKEEIVQFVNMAIWHPLEVRFLEFMPLCGSGWRPDLVLPIDQVRQVVFENFDVEEEPRSLDQVAQTFKIRNGLGKVGFIASLTESFCDHCSRIRLTADGRIRPCLFSEKEVPVKELLRRSAPDGEILEAIRTAARIKPAGNLFRERPFQKSGSPDFEFESYPLIRTIGG